VTRLTKTDLINWADTKLSEGQLPELIRRLIIASNQTLEAVVVPYGNSVGRSGLDGYVRATVGSSYVAAGESVWEFGTNKDHVSKANDDFKKRTNGTTRFRQQALTYHCITPRHWEKKAEWQGNPGPLKQKVVGHWREIRVYDVDDLLGWLAHCPAVDAWFSRILGKATAGLRDVNGYWENVGKTDTGIINAKVILAGREELTQRVQSHFAAPSGRQKPLAIASRSPAEVVPFAVASIIDGGNETVIASTVVVNSRTRWEQLIVEESGLGLIVTPQVQPTREELQHAFGCNHRVVYCSETGDSKLPRLSEFAVRQSLVSLGIGEGESTQHAKQCGGNGQLLLDRLSGLHAPANAIGSRLDDRVKVACLLLVGWNGEHTADREIFAILSGVPYEDAEASLVADANDPDGLLFRAAGHYRLLSPELAWIRYCPLITKRVTDTFADIIRYVLADDDPTAAMSGNERFLAQFLGQRPEFSGTLRQNIVHSLAIAGSMGQTHLRLDPSMSPSFVNWIVRSTLENASFGRWASLRNELSILAEAAPEALLDALERDLHTDGPLEKVMEKSEHDLFSSPAHVGILWALERLCWSSDYLVRAVSILVRLVSLNPEIKSGNNPSSSIRETLQLQCPQTNADWPERQRAIARMLEDDSKAAFPIVISLFPSKNSWWMHREKPAWRNWAYGYEYGVANRQLAIELHWCVEQLLLTADDNADRWCELLQLCGDIDAEQFDEILDRYSAELESNAFDDNAKRRLWETLNPMLVDMEWTSTRLRLKDGSVVDKDEIKDQDVEAEPHFPGEVHRYARFGPRLQKLREASTPDDKVLAGCHVFLCGLGNNHFSRHFSDRFDHKKQELRIVDSRKAVVERVRLAEGLRGLRRLAAITYVDARTVGRTMTVFDQDTGIAFEEIAMLYSSAAESDRSLASGFVEMWASKRKDSISTDVLPAISTMSNVDTKVSFMQCLPPVSEVWACVDAQDETVQRLYWKKAPLPWEIPAGRLSYLVRNLNHAARSDRAIDLVADRKEELGADDADMVFEVLESLPHVDRGATEPNRNGSLRWKIQHAFDLLYRIGMSQVERLVRLELLYHQVFENDKYQMFQPRALLIAIRDSPSLFVDLLTYPWNDDTGGSTMPDNESMKVFAKQISGLLNELVELPGQSDLCPMTDKTVAHWVAELIRIATERRYLTAVQLQLPRILTCRAWEAIAAWPTPSSIDAINVLAELDPQSLRSRLSNGLFNARGCHFVDPTGQSEKSRAEEFRKRASDLRQTCPTAAWALDDIARRLDSEAIRNVEHAQWER